MSVLRFIDTEKSLNSSGEDYLTLSNYHDSFYSAPNLSQLRFAMVPGTVKYFNREFDVPQNQSPYVGQHNVKIPVREAAITPLHPKVNYNDDCDYVSYSNL